MSYGILRHYDNVWEDTSYEQVNKYCHGWSMSSSEGRNPNLLRSATRDEIVSWVIEIWLKNHLVSDSNCNTVKLCMILQKIWQGMTNNVVGLTFSVGDTTLRFTVLIEQQDNQYRWHWISYIYIVRQPVLPIHCVEVRPFRQWSCD